MKRTERDQNSFETALGQLGAVNAVWPEAARDQMSKLVDQIVTSNDHIKQIIGSTQTVPAKAGFIAEEIHAETHNLEAILQKKTIRAITDKYEEWDQLGLPRRDWGGPDIVVRDNGEVIHTAQVKYYKNAEETAKALRANKDGVPKYDGTDSYIGPSDQVHPQDGSPSISDHANQTAQKNMSKRPHVAEAAKMVDEKTTDRLLDTSRPTTKNEARDVAKDNESGRKLRKDYQNEYMTRSTLQQMRTAAAGAAVTTAVIAGTMNTVKYLKLVNEGKLSPEQATLAIVKNTAVVSVDSAAKAAAATGAVSLATRAGIESLATQSVNGLLVKNSIAGAAICGVDLIKCLTMVAAGRMTTADLETRTGKNMLQTGAGVWGSSIGMAIAPAIPGGAVICALAGGFIAGYAMTVAIENHVEAAYQEVLNNGLLLESTQQVMLETAAAFVKGQQAFKAFVYDNLRQAGEFENTIRNLELLDDRMHEAINKI